VREPVVQRSGEVAGGPQAAGAVETAGDDAVEAAVGRALRQGKRRQQAAGAGRLDDQPVNGVTVRDKSPSMCAIFATPEYCVTRN